MGRDRTRIERLEQLNNSSTVSDVTGTAPIVVTTPTVGVRNIALSGSLGVSSVGLTMPAEFSVANSPVTSSGTLAVTKANQSANLIYAGPSSGAAAAPTFRAMVASDAPATIQKTFYAGSTSGTSTYTATLAPVPASYDTGSQYVVTITSANTGASTMNFNSLGAKTMQLNGAALAAGQLQAGATYQMVYDGTNLQISGQASSTSLPAGTIGQVVTYKGTNVATASMATTCNYGWQGSNDMFNIGKALASFATGDYPWTTYFSSAGSGSGQSLISTPEQDHPGVVSIAFGTTSGSGNALLQFGIESTGGNNGGLSLLMAGGSDIVWTFFTNATLSNGTTRYSITGGWQDNQTTAANSARFAYTDNVNSGALRIAVISNSVSQTGVNGSTVLLPSTWYRVRLNINAAYTAITLYLSVGTVSGGVTTWAAETQEAQYTGTMPLSNVLYFGHLLINKTLGVGNPALLVDSWEAAGYAGSPRGG